MEQPIFFFVVRENPQIHNEPKIKHEKIKKNYKNVWKYAN